MKCFRYSISASKSLPELTRLNSAIIVLLQGASLFYLYVMFSTLKHIKLTTVIYCNYSGEVIEQVKHGFFAAIDDRDDIFGMCIASKDRALWAAARDHRLLCFDL